MNKIVGGGSINVDEINVGSIVQDEERNNYTVTKIIKKKNSQGTITSVDFKVVNDLKIYNTGTNPAKNWKIIPSPPAVSTAAPAVSTAAPAVSTAAPAVSTPIVKSTDSNQVPVTAASAPHVAPSASAPAPSIASVPTATPAPVPNVQNLKTDSNKFELFKNAVNKVFASENKYVDKNINLAYSILPEQILKYQGFLTRGKNETKIADKNGEEVDIPTDPNSKTDIDNFKTYIRDTLLDGLKAINQKDNIAIETIIKNYANVNGGNNGEFTKTQLTNALVALDNITTNNDPNFIVSPIVTAILKSFLSLEQTYEKQEDDKRKAAQAIADAEVEKDRLEKEAAAEKEAAEKASQEAAAAQQAAEQAAKEAAATQDAAEKALAEQEAALAEQAAAKALAEQEAAEKRVEQLQAELFIIEQNISEKEQEITQINAKKFKAAVSFHLLLGDGLNKHKLLYISECEVGVSETEDVLPDNYVKFNRKNITNFYDNGSVFIDDFTEQIKGLLTTKIDSLNDKNKFYEFMKTYNEYNNANKVKYYDEQLTKNHISNQNAETIKVTYGIYLDKSSDTLCCTVDKIENTTNTNIEKAYLLTNEEKSLKSNINIKSQESIHKDFLNLGNQLYNQGGRRKSKRKSTGTKRKNSRKHRKTVKKHRKTRR